MNSNYEFTQQKIAKGKKIMLLVSMASMVMIFAGLTSAYVVSSKRSDWLKDFNLPNAFYISTLLIMLSSLTIYFSNNRLKQDKNIQCLMLLVLTLVLGIGFATFQFRGFSQIIEQGYYFTGSQSNVTTSFIYAIVLAHLAHVFSGFIVLLVLIYNQFKHKYAPTKNLGFELGSMYWHFLDIVWLYLILFFRFAG